MLKDVASLLAPASPENVLAALRGLRLFALLDGARGQARVDIVKLAQAISQLSQLAIADPRLREVDLNPIILPPGENAGLVAVDAVVRLAQADTQA